MEIVDCCPDSEEKWREAAARKNCAAYATNCSEPGELVYHCVLNTFVNETLAVCAYGRIIVLGKIRIVYLFIDEIKLYPFQLRRCLERAT